MSTPQKKIALITGANTGLGLETAKALLQSSQPWHRGEAAIALLNKDVQDTAGSFELVQIDVTSDDSITQAFEKVETNHGRIDALINNAGHAIEGAYNAGKVSVRELWTQNYNVNVAGAEVVTHTFMPLLLKSADPRLLFITSGLANFDTLARTYAPGPYPVAVPAGWPKPPVMSDSYRASKMATNAQMLAWHWKMQADGVKVWSVSPGFLATGLGGSPEKLIKMGAKDPGVGGRSVASVVLGERDADVGKVIFEDGVQPF
ncbi:putative short chain dehydrogenase [Mycena galopus ATCC 62051]|nr:putative short chain dehydrogenase [Mycena galopus ATCC 62051]